MERRWIQGKNTVIELVIFDLDGTLVRLPVRYDLLRNKLKEKFNIEGEFFIIPTILSKTKGNDELKKEAFEFICNEECNAINELEIYEGVIKIIKEIHSKDKKIALVTLQCERAATTILEIIGIRDLFSNIFTRDNYTNRYEQIINTMNKIEIKSNQTLMIGDRINDFESAKKAGCESIIIRRGKMKTDTNIGFDHEMKYVKDDIELKREISNLL